METRPRIDHASLLIGLGLVAAAIALVADQLVGNADLKDTIVFAGIAVLLAAAFGFTRAFGYLVAALAFAGLSAAKYAVLLGEDSGGAVLLGPGLGFLAAYAVGALALGRTHWWPLLVGAVLTLLGGLLVFGGDTGAQLAGQLWPIVLVAIGLLVLVGFAAGARRLPGRYPGTRSK